MIRQRSSRHLCRVFALCGVFLFVPFSVAFASDPEPPKGVGPLPDLSKGAKAGAVVTSQHIQSYRAVLPKEVADLVERGEFSFEAARNPREPARFSRAIASQTQSVEVSPAGELRGLSKAALPSALFPLGDYTGGDSRVFAYKALWNAAASMWRYPMLSLGFSVYIFPEARTAPHKLDFQLERIHPLSLGGAPGTLLPVFREKISARKPSAIQSLSWLTLRFFGEGEDFVWVASPVNRRIRQMTSSNRSDAIFTGMFSPDDLLVWSGKVELVEPLKVTQVPLLVPLVEAREAAPTKAESCLTRTFVGDAAMTLNHQSKRFASSAAWVPTNVIMALRSVWRIDLSSRDPFSNESQQALFIDQQSGLPVYQIVWDQSGRLRKVAIGFIRSLAAQGGDQELIIAGQAIVSGNEERRLVVLSDTLTSCGTYAPGTSLQDFDPSNFVKFEPRAAKEKRIEEESKSEDSLD